ncbi:MAG: hypothetical protein QCH31_05790 [Methanolobus sp.]|nr:hypothetical protein [Methanolobus sp.]
MKNKGTPMEMMASDMMPAMMKKCMQIQQNMMGFAKDDSDMATYGTPELKKLFEEWLDQVNEDLVEIRKETNDTKEIAQKLNLSEESVNFLISRSGSKGRSSGNL